MGGNYVVGFVLFLALIAIQFLVVSHGAVRTAEVTARFTLDAMPGKQMAIDADLNAGIIDEAQARTRRENVAHEAEFYGAMDGAARFNQRDAMATILITAINIIAGFLIGVFQFGIPLGEALKTYTVLTVGDGLVTMIPSLLVSVGGGIVLTRASSRSSLGSDLQQQLFSNARVLWIAAGVILSLALIPGLPKLTFVCISAGAALLARQVSNQEKKPKAADASALAEPAPGAAQEALESLLALDELSLEVGYGLVPLVDAKQGGQLLQRVRALRKHLAVQLGFIVPPVHITDNLRLKPREYVVYLRGVEIARWEMHEGSMLAISSDPLRPRFKAKIRASRLSVFRRSGSLLPRRMPPARPDMRLSINLGAGDDLAELIKQHAYELLSRHETKRLVDRLGESHPKLLDELVPKLMSPGEVQKVLQQLLAPNRCRSAIWERFWRRWWKLRQQQASRGAGGSGATGAGPGVGPPLLNDEGNLNVMTVDATLEEELARSFQPQCRRRALYSPVLAARAGLLETHDGRAGHDGDSGSALRLSRALSSASSAGAVLAESGGAVAGRNSPGGAGAVIGVVK